MAHTSARLSYEIQQFNREVAEARKRYDVTIKEAMEKLENDKLDTHEKDRLTSLISIKFEDSDYCAFGGDPPSGDSVQYWREWKNVYMYGPKGTPYEKGRFGLLINLPDDYPFKAPKIKFTTRVFHPNVSSSGDICVDILKESWSPSLTIIKVLLSISSLLNEPNPNDPLNPTAAGMYKEDRRAFDAEVSRYVREYASSITPSNNTIDMTDYSDAKSNDDD